MRRAGTYVLVTPARNEESHIARTIEAVLAQTWLPSRWIIVSDGSTDRTDEIVSAYAAEHEFIEFVRSARSSGGRDFGSKVQAFNAGYAQLAGVTFDYIGNLDADVSDGIPAIVNAAAPAVFTNDLRSMDYL